MLFHKTIGAGGTLGGGPIEHIGSIVFSPDPTDARGWDAPGEGPDVLSLASVGDLVVVAFSFDLFTLAPATWSWGGMAIVDIANLTNLDNPGTYVGYRIVQPGDTNPYLVGAGGSFYALSAVVSVFRNAESFVSSSVAAGSSGMPNPPSVASAGNLWVATAHFDATTLFSASVVAPTNYILAGVKGASGGNGSGTAIAYRIEELPNEDPAAYTGNVNKPWRSITAAFL
jgi:hypothetical protein